VTVLSSELFAVDGLTIRQAKTIENRSVFDEKLSGVLYVPRCVSTQLISWVCGGDYAGDNPAQEDSRQREKNHRSGKLLDASRLFIAHIAYSKCAGGRCADCHNALRVISVVKYLCVCTRFIIWDCWRSENSLERRNMSISVATGEQGWARAHPVSATYVGLGICKDTKLWGVTGHTGAFVSCRLCMYIWAPDPSSSSVPGNCWGGLPDPQNLCVHPTPKPSSCLCYRLRPTKGRFF